MRPRLGSRAFQQDCPWGSWEVQAWHSSPPILSNHFWLPLPVNLKLDVRTVRFLKLPSKEEMVSFQQAGLLRRAQSAALFTQSNSAPAPQQGTLNARGAKDIRLSRQRRLELSHWTAQESKTRERRQGAGAIVNLLPFTQTQLLE